MTTAADRHLLFGRPALQNGLINQGALFAAFLDPRQFQEPGRPARRPG